MTDQKQALKLCKSAEHDFLNQETLCDSCHELLAVFTTVRADQRERDAQKADIEAESEERVADHMRLSGHGDNSVYVAEKRAKTARSIAAGIRKGAE